jgi:hypothetical protein
MEIGMAEKRSVHSPTLDASVARMASLLRWWESSEIDWPKEISEQLGRRQLAFLAIQDAWTSSSQRHAEALASLNESVTGALAEMASSHDPASWIEIEGRLFDAMSDRLGAIAHIWLELANEVNDRTWSITNAGNGEPPTRMAHMPSRTAHAGLRTRGNGASASDRGIGRTTGTGKQSGRSVEIEQ